MTTMVKASFPRPATLAGREEKLRAAVALNLVRKERTSFGSALIQWRGPADGSEPPQPVVRKSGDAVQEFLAARVGDALGIAMPAVIWAEDVGSIYMEFIEGKLPAASLTKEEVAAHIATPEGLRIGLLDQLIVNGDRHNANWISVDGVPVPIDHGGAFWHLQRGLRVGDHAGSAFARDALIGYPELTAREMDSVCERLAGLLPVFRSVGRESWHDRVMEEAALVRSKAR